MARKVAADRKGGGRYALLTDALLRDMERLSEDQETFDLEFIVGSRQERVRAHRLIVLCRCEAYGRKRGGWSRGAAGAVVTVRLANYDVQPVRSVVKYLYTGKLNLRENDMFQILALCSEFGLPALKDHCIEHFGSCLTVADVCPMLDKTETLLQGCTAEGIVSSLEGIVDQCLSFIHLNAKAVLQSEGFLELSKESLIAVISSDKLAVPEEEVWRSVMRWGQHNAGVKQSVVLWSEGERRRMEVILTGVLEHIRVMEIGSEVFAKEVEPTGLLPMEMTLARYRQAAVYGKGGSNGEQVSPRSGVQEPFQDSEVLGGRMDLQVKICEWCGVPTEEEWVLLYRGSRDGFHAKKFHSCCDDKGPTVVIVKTPGGNVFGGYADVSWSSRFKRGKFTGSQKSFLFTLVNPSNTPPSKFDIKQHSYAINNHPGNGPIFGSGADLCISSDCNRNKDSYSQLPYSYGDSSTVPPHLLTGEQYFTVEDYEVFGLAG